MKWLVRTFAMTESSLDIDLAWGNLVLEQTFANVLVLWTENDPALEASGKTRKRKNTIGLRLAEIYRIKV
jgi:hypothetical protein